MKRQYLFIEAYAFLITHRSQLLLLTSDTLFQFHHSYKSCETRPVRGA